MWFYHLTFCHVNYSDVCCNSNRIFARLLHSFSGGFLESCSCTLAHGPTAVQLIAPAQGSDWHFCRATSSPCADRSHTHPGGAGAFRSLWIRWEESTLRGG